MIKYRLRWIVETSWPIWSASDNYCCNCMSSDRHSRRSWQLLATLFVHNQRIDSFRRHESCRPLNRRYNVEFCHILRHNNSSHPGIARACSCMLWVADWVRFRGKEKRNFVWKFLNFVKFIKLTHAVMWLVLVQCRKNHQKIISGKASKASAAVNLIELIGKSVHLLVLMSRVLELFCQIFTLIGQFLHQAFLLRNHCFKLTNGFRY